MKTRMRKSDLLNLVWGLKGQRDDAIEADENTFWNKWWNNEYSEYVPAFLWWCHICLFQNCHIRVVHGNKCPFVLPFAIFSKIRLKFAKCLDGNTMWDRMSRSDGWWRIINWAVPVGPITELQLHYRNIGRTSLWLRLRSRNTHAAKLFCAALIAWQKRPQMIWLMRAWQSFRRRFLEKSIWFTVICINVNYKWSQLK